MNTRTFLKTLCLVPIGAVVEKLPGHGVSQVSEPMMGMPRGFIPPKKLFRPIVVKGEAILIGRHRNFLWHQERENGCYRLTPLD